jgi:hypothetical protein
MYKNRKDKQNIQSKNKNKQTNQNQLVPQMNKQNLL